MNLYMPVYEQLESEVIALTNNILFNDKQINVCSLNIGNIIIRCAIEIEAISKELYKQLSGTEKRPYFDKHCIALLNHQNTARIPLALAMQRKRALDFTFSRS